MDLNRNEEPEWASLREFLRIQLRHIEFEHPNSGYIKECPNCRFRVPMEVGKVHSEDQIIETIFGYFYRFYHELALKYDAALYAKSLAEIELTPLQEALLAIRLEEREARKGVMESNTDAE